MDVRDPAAGQAVCLLGPADLNSGRGLLRVEITANRVAVEGRRLSLAHDHTVVLLADVLFGVTWNRDDDAGFVAKAPMARSLAAEFGKALID
jgi:hypothetical protein